VATDVPGSLMMSSEPNRLSKNREIKVHATRLSSYVNGSVDLLKLDVEGAEFDVMTDLERSGKLSLIKRMVIEYHHKIGNRASSLAQFLAILEKAGFEYQIYGDCEPVTRQDVFQDILIGAYRPSR
jgi:Methyltransferase FkbM domain